MVCENRGVTWVSGPSWVLITEHMLPPVNSDLVGSEGLRRPTELT